MHHTIASVNKSEIPVQNGPTNSSQGVREYPRNLVGAWRRGVKMHLGRSTIPEIESYPRFPGKQENYFSQSLEVFSGRGSVRQPAWNGLRGHFGHTFGMIMLKIPETTNTCACTPWY